MKRYFYFWLFFAICLLHSCKTERHHTSSAKEVRFEPQAELKNKMKELQSLGIDSFILFAKDCKTCKHHIHKADKKGKSLIPVNESLPAYLFWVNKGQYFVMKADPFHLYKPVKRSFSNQYAIYDYWTRYKSAILGDDFPSSQFTQNGILKNRHYVQPEFSDTSDADHSVLHIQISSDSINFSIDKIFASPVQVPKNTDNVGNTAVTYFDNLLMKRYEFERIIESELFEIEFKYLWVIEK